MKASLNPRGQERKIQVLLNKQFTSKQKINGSFLSYYSFHILPFDFLCINIIKTVEDIVIAIDDTTEMYSVVHIFKLDEQPGPLVPHF